jgi:hypothetical protein
MSQHHQEMAMRGRMPCQASAPHERAGLSLPSLDVASSRWGVNKTWTRQCRAAPNVRPLAERPAYLARLLFFDVSGSSRVARLALLRLP